MMERNLDHTEWRFAYAALIVLAAAVFMYATRSVLSPLVAYILLLVLLVPYAGTRHHRVAVIAATVLIAVWLLDTLGTLLSPFLLAMGVAYILDPAVDWLERRGLSRMAAIAVLALPVLGVLFVFAFFGVPALLDQASALISRVPEALQRLLTWFEAVRQRLMRMNLPVFGEVQLFRDLDPQSIATYLQSRQEAILVHAWDAFVGVGRGFSFVLALLGYVVLTPVLIIYLLRDFDAITARVMGLVPEPRAPGVRDFSGEYERLLSRFLRGQLIEATLVGLLTWFGLWVVGFPYSGLVGAVAGVFNLVPYLGLVVSIVPVLLIALVSGDFLSAILRAAAVFAVVQVIDGTITGPRIVGESVGLHPVWVILALAVGSFFFGFVGLLLAMPAAVFIKLFLRRAIARYRASSVFRGTAVAEAGDPGAGGDA